MNVFNLHFLETCNYRCVYCFSPSVKRSMPLEKIFTLIDKIANYTNEFDIKNPRINLAGGEPFLYTDLGEVIEYIKSKRMDVSIITNASLLTYDFLHKYHVLIDSIGISVDALSKVDNIRIGRADQEQRTLSLSQIIEKANWVKGFKIKLKLNIVVSKLNLNVEFFELIQRTMPERLKFIKMHVIDDKNSHAGIFAISDAAFNMFTEKYLMYNPVIETNTDLQNSYIIIDSEGNVLRNDTGYISVGNAFDTPMHQLIEALQLNHKAINKRYIKTKGGDSLAHSL